MNLTPSDIDAIASRVAKKLRPPLVKVTALAAELDVHPRTVLRKMAKCGIPKRDMQGKPHTGGDAIYVYRREWERGERVSDRMARGAAI